MTRVRVPHVWSRLVAIVLVGLVAFAWGGGAAFSAAAGPEKPSITVGLSQATGTLSPVYVAADQGLFQKEGLNVQLVTFNAGADLTKAVLGGSVDIGIGALAGFMLAVLAGEPLKVVYGGFNMPLMSWWAVPSISSVADLKGKNWGITGFGSSTDLLTRFVVQQKGLSLKDVNIVPIGGTDSGLAAMEAGRIQVLALGAPGMFQARDMGFKDVIDLSTLVKGYPYHVVAAMSGFLRNDPNTVTAFLRALSLGIQMTRSNPRAAADALAKHVGVDEKYAIPTIGTFVNYLYADGRLPDKASMDAFWGMGLNGGGFRARVADYVWLDPKWIETYRSWKP